MSCTSSVNTATALTDDLVLLGGISMIGVEIDMPTRDAEAALAFLVEQGMVEVAGDKITVPASFWSGGQVPAT